MNSINENEEEEIYHICRANGRCVKEAKCWRRRRSGGKGGVTAAAAYY